MLLATLRSASPTRQSNGSWDFVAGAMPYNAVRVNAERIKGSTAGPVRLLVGGMLGVHTFEPSHVATASQVDQDVVLVLDRSGSMAWDMSGVDWKYPAPLTYPAAYCLPPHATLSRWAGGGAPAAVDAFLTAMSRLHPSNRSPLSVFQVTAHPAARRFWRLAPMQNLTRITPRLVPQ